MRWVDNWVKVFEGTKSLFIYSIEVQQLGAGTESVR
jgi:hypothetical protein